VRWKIGLTGDAALVIILFGCQGGCPSPPTSPSTARVSRFLYVMALNDRISGFAVLPPTSFCTTCANLKLLGYSHSTLPWGGIVTTPFVPLPNSPFMIALSSAGIASFKRDDTNGSLTFVANVTRSSSSFAFAMHPSGRFLIVGGSGPPHLEVWRIDPTTGVASLIYPMLPFMGNPPDMITIDPAGKFVYVLDTTAGQISVFSFDANTGNLQTVGLPVSPLGSPGFFALDTTGQYLFAGGYVISMFQVNSATGSLTTVGGSPPVLDGPISGLTVDSATHFLYLTTSVAVSGTGGSIWSYPINKSTGALGAGTHVPCGCREPRVDATGQFVYAITDDPSIKIFSSDPGSGALSLVDQIPTTPGPLGITLIDGASPVSFAPKFIYVLNRGSNTVSGYSVDGATGRLTALTPVGIWSTGARPTSAVIDQTGRFLYVTNGNDNTVSEYVIDQSKGSLTAIGTAKTGNTPVSAAAMSDVVWSVGPYLDVVNNGSNTLSAFAIDRTTGVLGPNPFYCSGGPCSDSPTDPFPTSVAISPTGHEYISAAGNQGSITLAGNLPTPTPGVNPVALLLDSHGKRAYLVGNSTQIQVFDLDVFDSTRNGNYPTGNATFGAAFPTQSAPVSIAIDPRDRYVYVVNMISGSISEYLVDSAKYLIPAGVIKIGPLPSAAVVDPSGMWLFVTTENPPSISSFKIDPVFGALTLVGSAPTGSFPGAIVVTQVIN
jgi:6-phosphogluconolactonase (cycloisomerase 2 family)